MVIFGDGKKGTLLQSLKHDFDAAKEVQDSYDGEWKLALAFLGGAQYTQYDRARRTIDEAPRPTTPRRRRRPIHNMIAPNFEINTSKLGAFIPQLVALAGTPESNDMAASKVSTHRASRTGVRRTVARPSRTVRTSER